MGQKKQEIPQDVLEAMAEEMVASERASERPLAEQLGRALTKLGRLERRVKELEKEARTHTHEEGEPPARMGVYIDEEGRYFMRRPDGWHTMVVVNWAEHKADHLPQGQIQRLAEKD